LDNPDSRNLPVKAAAVLAVIVIGLGGAYFLLFNRATTGDGQSVTSTTVAASSSTQTRSSSQTSSTADSSSSSSSTYSSASSTRSVSSSSSSSSSSVAAISHIIIIVMENEGYNSVIGNASAPYQNSLAASYALAANYFAVSHPSLPNYLSLIGGSTFGVTTDCLPAQCSLPGSVSTVANLLDAQKLTWREYAESMPGNCSQVNSPDGLYFTKHNPFAYFGAITGNNGTGSASDYCDSHVVPMGQLWLDLQAGALPSYSFITPNICDDAHSCPLAIGDQWLSTIVPKVIGSSSFAATALFIVYDEGGSNDANGGGGQVACILVSPLAKTGYASHVAYSHYSLLATVEAIFNLGNLGRDEAAASVMSDLFTNWVS
jgi:phosphatidylinositol-3-phosphatase